MPTSSTEKIASTSCMGTVSCGAPSSRNRRTLHAFARARTAKRVPRSPRQAPKWGDVEVGRRDIVRRCAMQDTCPGDLTSPALRLDAQLLDRRGCLNPSLGKLERFVDVMARATTQTPRERVVFFLVDVRARGVQRLARPDIDEALK